MILLSWIRPGSGSAFTKFCGSASLLYTVCPGSSEPFYTVSYYIKWVTTFWTHSTKVLDIQYLLLMLSSYSDNTPGLRRRPTMYFLGKAEPPPLLPSRDRIPHQPTQSMGHAGAEGRDEASAQSNARLHQGCQLQVWLRIKLPSQGRCHFMQKNHILYVQEVFYIVGY